MKTVVHSDIIIAGAGPAGSVCALALAGSGLTVTLFDACAFPRDKICGDAIPHRAVQVINTVAPSLGELLKNHSRLMPSAGCRVVAPDLKFVDVFFKLEGYLSKRFDFDNLLLHEALRSRSVRFFQNEKTIRIDSGQQGITVETTRYVFKGQLIIGCDGAHSEIRKHFFGNTIDPEHYCAAVRAYYKNVKDVTPGMMEIYLIRHLPFAYFWIFPLPDGWVNAGLGMLSKQVARQKINLKNTMEAILGSHRLLANRFSAADRQGEIRGFGLPLGSKRNKISGNRFMLCGDAASLIDPATGEGIGNAMLSGMLAARQATVCFSKNDFSESLISRYEDAVYSRLKREFRSKYFLQQLIGKRPFFASALIGLASRSGWLQKKFQKLF